jgi:hypothetical protein
MIGVVKRIFLAAGVVLTLAACGSGSTSSATAPSSPALPPSAVPSVDAATAGRVCAAVNALVSTGDTGAIAIATAASAYHVTQAQVVGAIDDRCPALKSIVPARTQ